MDLSNTSWLIAIRENQKKTDLIIFAIDGIKKLKLSLKVGMHFYLKYL